MFWVHTSREIEHLWAIYDSLSNREVLKQILTKRIHNGFYGLKFEEITKQKEKFNGQANEQNHIHIMPLLKEDDVDDRLLKEISNSIVQGKELFTLGSKSSELSQPLLLFYGMESMGHALILSTYQEIALDKSHYRHGLEIQDGNEELRIRRKGFYPRLHDCLSSDISIYKDETIKITLNELFKLNPEIRQQYQLVFGDEETKYKYVDLEQEKYDAITYQGKEFDFIEIIYLTMFILSNKARYDPGKWIDELKNTKLGYLSKVFMEFAYRRFPNLILNRMYGDHIILGPPARLC